MDARIERKPWTIISGAREGGIYKSTDGGETWAKVGGGLPNGLIGKSDLAVTRGEPEAHVRARSRRSRAAGCIAPTTPAQTWTRVNSPPAIDHAAVLLHDVDADPTNADVVYGGAEGFYKSTDGGRTFAAMRTPHGDNHDMWINPRDGNTMSRRTTAAPTSRSTAAHVEHAEQPADGRDLRGRDGQPVPVRLYGAQQDNSTLIVPSLAGPDDTRADWRARPGLRDGPDHPAPDQPRHRLRLVQGPVQCMSLQTGQEKQLLGGRAVAVRQPRRAI